MKLTRKQKYRQTEKGKKTEKLYYQKYYKNQVKIIEELKINGCAVCGYNKCTRALDFHHVNPKNMKFRLNVNNICKNPKVVAEELYKCILLCANCHREVHSKK